MKKILVIDNNIDPPYGCAEIVDQLKASLVHLGEADIFTRRGPDGAIPESAEGIDGVVISGSKTRIKETSPWIEKQMKFIETLHREKIPTFGICYGEQLIARTLAGDDSVGVSKVYEYGWVPLEVLPEAAKSEVFNVLPPRFHSWEFHSDEVFSLPESQFRVTARSANCAIQAFDVLDAPMWGVQFHPERTLALAEQSVARIRSNDPKRVLINPDRGAELYDRELVIKIFRAFLAKVFQRKA